MGNKASASHTPKSNAPNPQLVSAFDRISESQQSISHTKFQEKFGKHISEGLWKYLKGGSEDSELTKEQFYQNGQSLLMGSDELIRVMMPVDLLLNACLEANDIQEEEKDKKFLESLQQDMTINGDTCGSIIQWKNNVCPRLCQTLQDKILDVFFGRSRPSGMIQSDILSTTQAFILCHCLPTTVFFPQLESQSQSEEQNVNKQWTKLYSSVSQGISINRFEANCFNYKGATVAIFKLTNEDIYAIAADQEWRHSVKKFGGPNSILFQLHPLFKRIDAESPAIYCNFKTRSSTPLGLTFGRGQFSLDGDMANLFDMEVWGCAGGGALEEQQKQKLWLKRQAEKNSTVPMPGNWDDNPDKSIMEMHGFQFSNERNNDRPADC
uniref:TLDc domain-containing protein n=1 Tax=Ditylenchus dipsaci TaxID=166011 RepID=A0A915EEE9_9BILA